jgi:hypothetical protein
MSKQIGLTLVFMLTALASGQIGESMEITGQVGVIKSAWSKEQILRYLRYMEMIFILHGISGHHTYFSANLTTGSSQPPSEHI